MFLGARFDAVGVTSCEDGLQLGNSLECKTARSREHVVDPWLIDWPFRDLNGFARSIDQNIFRAHGGLSSLALH